MYCHVRIYLLWGAVKSLGGCYMIRRGSARIPARPCAVRWKRGMTHRSSPLVFVGPSGIEPLTSSVSRKRSPSELRARMWGASLSHPGRRSCRRRRRPELNRGDGFCRPAPNHSATSPVLQPQDRGHRRAGRKDRHRAGLGAEDGARTRDLNLGKVALYQLSYFREGTAMIADPPAATNVAGAAINGPSIRTHRRLGRTRVGTPPRRNRTPAQL